MGEVRWDPYDVELDDQPYEMWARMRAEAPVYRNHEYDFFALTRHRDVEAAHRDTATFSSAHGTVLERMSVDPSDQGGLLIFLDPPQHTALRATMSRALTPRRVTRLTEDVRLLCAELLDPHRGEAGFDYLSDFGAQLPSRVISTLVGVPPADQEALRRLVDEMFHIEPGVGMVNDRSAAAALSIAVYLRDLVRERTARPGDDLISDLVAAELVDDGRPRRLTLDESTAFAILLYAAGTETVAKLLGNAAVVLADHPDQRAELATEPALVPAAVEELLRFEPPSPVQGRWTTREVELHGVRIPKDAKVLLVTGSAGRDGDVYPDPNRFDIRRKPQHLSFGYGAHFCLGAALARLEGRVAIEETLARFPSWEVDRSRVRRVHTSTVRGYRSVPIEL